MKVPNLLFYDNLIKCGYVSDIQKVFLYSNKPFLFVDVTNGQEQLKGTSFVNFQEVDATVDMANLCVRQFSEVKELNEEISAVAEQRFTRNSIFVITPYNAQKNAIADRFVETNTQD